MYKNGKSIIFIGLDTLLENWSAYPIYGRKILERKKKYYIEIGGRMLIGAVSMRGPTFQSGSAPLI